MKVRVVVGRGVSVSVGKGVAVDVGRGVSVTVGVGIGVSAAGAFDSPGEGESPSDQLELPSGTRPNERSQLGKR